MANVKELGYLSRPVVRKILQNIILVNYMAVQRWNMQMVTSIGGNTRMVRRKDMEHLSGLVERDISGNTCRVTCTGMEYTDGQMEVYIMDSGKRIRRRVTGIGRVVMAQNIMDSGRTINEMETQF
jgi:hypothetical protein